MDLIWRYILLVDNNLADCRVDGVLFTQDQIKERVKELAEKITLDYVNEVPLVISVLKGSAVFAVDLIRQIDGPLELDFISVSSYGNSTTSSGEVKILKDLDIDVAGRDVLIVEDIVDSGLTLNFLVEHIAKGRPASIATCSLLLRKLDSIDEPPLDYFGFRIGDDFVIGYGLDYAQQFRGLPYIATLTFDDQVVAS